MWYRARRGLHESYSTRRIEALTDGVFAIAMTLLVLDLKVSDLGEALNSKVLLDALSENTTNIITFVVSFLFLGSMWAVHTRQFEYIKRADRRLITLNTLRLLIVVLIPLSTSIAGSYSDLVLGRILLPINFLLLATISAVQWNYATNPKHKLYDKISPKALRNSLGRNQAIVYLSFVVVILSIWVGEYAFILLLLANPLVGYLDKKNLIFTPS